MRGHRQAVVDLKGTVGGHPIDDRFAPILAFSLDDAALRQRVSVLGFPSGTPPAVPADLPIDQVCVDPRIQVLWAEEAEAPHRPIGAFGVFGAHAALLAKDRDGVFRIGVATGTRPEGPFRAEPQPIHGRVVLDHREPEAGVAHRVSRVVDRESVLRQAAIGDGITEKTGLEQPLFHWTPSIAPSGMAFVTTDMYGPGWQGSLLVGSLKFRYLARLQIDGARVVKEDKLLTGLGQRVRDVREGPDGFIYLLTDARDGELLRLRPATGAAS